MIEREIALDRDAVAAFIARARRTGEERAGLPREPGKWTPCQVAAHLAGSYAAFARSLVDGVDLQTMFPEERVATFREKVLPRILDPSGSWFPIGGSAPPESAPPDAPGTMAETLARLADAARAFESGCVRAAATTPDREVFHPYFGPMRIADLLVLSAAHTRHHAAQLPEA
ncbi:MAG TPA: DinB family protein [Gemmatimonadales bacterium]|nr:DinB family protein [Gemmatimonadales bacterium]